MPLASLYLTNYRNFVAAEFHPSPAINLITGGNGQGKSNLLEAIYYLGLGRSFRDLADSYLIRLGADFMRIEGEVEGHNLALAATAAPRRKTLWINGVKQGRLSTLYGYFPVLAFTPEDLYLIKGPPEVRRSFLDQALEQVVPGYADARLRLRRILAQRNRLLAGGEIKAGRSLLDVWDHELLQVGSRITTTRLRALGMLSPLAVRFYREISGEDLPLVLVYRPGGLRQALMADVVIDDARIREMMTAVAAARKGEELARGQTLVGPHRDEISFVLGDNDMRFYASQGQQRTMALALRLAQRELLRGEWRERLTLILDDIFSELDSAHQQRLAQALDGQVFLATCQPDQLPAAVREKIGLIVRVTGGEVRSERIP